MIRVILCTYNGEKYLREQLDSIANQTILDWKICAYDDRSTDRTIELLQKFGADYPGKVEVHRNSELFGASRNFLYASAEQSLDMTDDDYIMFCDQDDIWDADKMEVSLNEMGRLISTNGNEEPLLVFGDSRVVDEQLNPICDSLMSYNNYDMSHLGLSYELMENKMQGCTIMINSELARMLQKRPDYVGMYDGYTALLALSMGHVSYLGRTVLKYRRWKASVSSTEDYKEVNKSKFGHLSEQKYIVFDYAPTIKEILRLFGDRISTQNKKVMESFAALQQKNWIMRRLSIIRYHMWKTGFVRNAGLRLLI